MQLHTIALITAFSKAKLGCGYDFKEASYALLCVKLKILLASFNKLLDCII